MQFIFFRKYFVSKEAKKTIRHFDFQTSQKSLKLQQVILIKMFLM